MGNSENRQIYINTSFESHGCGYLTYKKLSHESKSHIFYKGVVLLAIVAFFCAFILIYISCF